MKLNPFALRLDVEPASIDTNKIESSSSTNPISPVNAVAASEPISNSIIEETLANSKSPANSYQASGLQNQSTISPGSLIDIKV